MMLTILFFNNKILTALQVEFKFYIRAAGEKVQ